MNNASIKLYLASGSDSRKRILTESLINFEMLSQNADEKECDWTLSLKELVTAIAIHKMNNVILPETAEENQKILVLTADTLTIDGNGKVSGKPTSKKEVIQKIESYKKGAVTGTAFCLDLKIFQNGIWSNLKREIGYAAGSYIYDIPYELIDWYLENCFSGLTYKDVSGGVVVDGAGAQFLKSIEGSISAVVGMPMYELRMALLKFGYL